MSVVRALSPYGRASRRDRHDRCELCGAAIGDEHPHVADTTSRSLACACRPCAILFAQPGAGGGTRRTVPDRILGDSVFVLKEKDWNALEVPVRLAFFFFSSVTKGWIALYPGPAGATEAEVPRDAWAALTREVPLVAEATPDLEAIVAWAPRGATTAECFLVPITACYELTSRLRQTWRGIDGGDEARATVSSFFERLRRQCRPVLRAGGAS